MKKLIITACIMAILSSISLATAKTVMAAATDSWAVKADLAVKRPGLGAAVVNGRIYAVGGADGANVFNTVEEYDPGTGAWSTKTPLPAARGFLGVVALNGKIYALGGWDKNKYLDKVEEYDPATNSWTTRTHMPTARMGLGAVAVNDKIYAIGGRNDGGTLKTVEVYDPATDSWSTKADLRESREFFGVSALNGRIYAVNGMANNSYRNTVEVYDPVVNSWTYKNNLAVNLAAFGMASVNDKIYIMGGLSNYFLHTSMVKEYDPLNDTWTDRANLPVAASGLAAVALSGRIYAMGGANSTSNLSAFQEYTPPGTETVPDSWAQKTIMSTIRKGLSSVAATGEIYAIGGNNNSGRLAAVEAYNPATNSWRSRSPMPTPRGELAAVTLIVNGREKIYCLGGGSTSGPVYNTVEAYDPATGSWETKAGMNYPRIGCGAAVFHNKIYVFGGYSGDTVCNSVEEYDPAANVWTIKTGMPTARWRLGVVTAGSKIYAIGGCTDNAGQVSVPTVEEYDPMLNSWQIKTPLIVPLCGFGIAAVNNRVYLMGGYNGSVLNQTLEYNTTTGVSQELAQMPTARWLPGAAQIDGKIYVMGGAGDFPATIILDTVEVYTPPVYPDDGIAPVLEVWTPAEGVLINSTGFTVSGTVSDDTDTIIKVNGQAVLKNGSSFQVNLTGVEGVNHIIIEATDNGGNTTTVTRQIIIDSQGPAAFIPNVDPAGWTHDTSANVTFSTTDAISGLYYYQIRLDEGDWSTPASSPHRLDNLVDGEHTVWVRAIDHAGNETIGSVQLQIDTQGPSSFTPAADSTDWTNNNRPVITFGTTDTLSGIAYYLLRVDDREWTTPVSSPYQLGALPDGEHTIQVKAVDRAGNETCGSDLTVRIDTTLPSAPAGFKVIPGASGIILKWDELPDEVVACRITRTPGFAQGEYLDLARGSGAFDQYTDPDVTSGQTYMYTLTVLDHAGNYSLPTEQLVVEAGSASQEVGQDGGTVQYDACTITVPAGALAESAKVVVKEAEPLPANTYAVPISPAYSFTLQNQAGEEIPAEFSEPVNLEISYKDLTIPAGYTEADLGVYWYNRETGDWEKLDRIGIDPETKTLEVPLEHFSEYQVMASQYVMPSLESYNELGVSPSQSYFNNNQEIITAASGNICVGATDLSLPGRDGFDLVLRRIYDGEANRQSKILQSNTYVIEKETVNTFGDGWGLNIPWIETNESGKFIRMPEGQTFKVVFTDKVFENKKGTYFKLKVSSHTATVHEMVNNIWIYVTKTIIESYTLTLKDGTVYNLDKDGKPTQQTDPSGKNTITYAYNDKTLTKITDSLGREINFTYQTITFTINGNKITKQVISEINYADRTFQYGYDAASGMLINVTDPLNRVTRYDYEAQTIYTGLKVIGAAGSKTKYCNINLLNSITYPTGGISTYRYDVRSQDYSEKSGNITLMYYNSKISVANHTVGQKVASYSYQMNSVTGKLNSSYFVPANTYINSCVIKEGKKITTQTFQQMAMNTTKKTYRLIAIPAKGEESQGTVMLSNQTSDVDGKFYEMVKYQYQLPQQGITLEEHFRSSSSTSDFQITASYDTYGNPTQWLDSSCNLEQTWTYHTHSRIKNLVDTLTRNNLNPLTNTKEIVTTSYTYDDTLGKILQMTVTADGKQATTVYVYNDNGTLQSLTKPNQMMVSFLYDDTYQAYPKQMTEAKAIIAEDGTSVDKVLHYDYDPVTGLKTAETDGRGHWTHYRYDKLNRMVRVVLPDDDGDADQTENELVNNPYREYIFDDQNNRCDFYNEKRQYSRFNFDNLGRLTEDVKYHNGAAIKTVYDYDELGRIVGVTDPKGNRTLYQYDPMNRVIRVTFPRSNNEDTILPSVTLDYNDATNTVAITDESGNITTEHSDWANRLVEAVQNCSYGNISEKYQWEFNYDSLGNRIRQIDPKNGTTNPGFQTFDGFNRLIQEQLPGVSLAGSDSISHPTLNYQYDIMGNRIAETDARGGQVRNEYDLLGNLIKTTTYAADGQTALTTVQYFYDADGHPIRTIDANQKVWDYTYSARGWLLAEKDPAGNVTRYQYDALGNMVAKTDPRNKTGYTVDTNGQVILDETKDDRTFTTWYIYDDMNRLIRIVQPDATPPDEAALQSGAYDNSYTELAYDENGNRMSERDPNGVTTTYVYTPRNMQSEVRVAGEKKASYKYDHKNNPIEITDALGHVTYQDFDSLGGLRKVTHPEGNREQYTYDPLGNRAGITDGRGNTTSYEYNALEWLTAITDPLGHTTSYLYDGNGNQVKTTASNGLVTQYTYDELNRLVETTDPLGKASHFSYDGNGNRIQMTDRRGSTWKYSYTDNNLLDNLKIYAAGNTNPDSPDYHVSYTYDEAGNRKTVEDDGSAVAYNLDEDGHYQADPLNRVHAIRRTFDHTSYFTRYQYNKDGQVTGLLYPEASQWLEYQYDSQNRVSQVKNFTAQEGISYQADNTLKSITYQNGVVTSFRYDLNRRLSGIQAGKNGTDILQLSYTYDESDNITHIVDAGKTKRYEYDKNNQLTKAVTPGKYLENQASAGTYCLQKEDYGGTEGLIPTVSALIGLDRYATSIGIDFSGSARVKLIVLTPVNSPHRLLKQKMLDLYQSADNSAYTIIPRKNWTFAIDSAGVITLTLNEAVVTRYLKVHVKFDDWDGDGNPIDHSQFMNELAKLLKVYQESDSQTEEYAYDAAGNRSLKKVSLIQTSTSFNYEYYAKSDRLKTDGKYAFVYDDAGNLVTKGNRFNINGDTVSFTATTGEGVEYWQYTYNLLNRLTEVSKNGAVVANYEYSPDGLRQVKRGSGGAIHYVFEGTEPIFEKRISDGRVRSYVYALGSHLARVDGAIGDTSAKMYYYHTDQVGSVKAVTDSAGKTVYNADYLAFGTQFAKDGDFDETHGFTGKEYDSDTGLYYFAGRWYDPDLGRFISEDPVDDPNSPNLYSYCANNPLSNIDPTGYDLASTISSICSAISSAFSSIGSAISSAASSVGHAISSAVSSVSRAISNAVSSVANAINSAVSSACSALSNAWNKMTGNDGPGNDTSEAINRFFKNQPKYPSQDPEEKIKEMMENDPFHKGGSSDDHGGSGYSSEIAKKFGPQLPDFSRTDSFVMVIPLIYLAVDGITALSVGGGILTGIIGGKIYLASKGKKGNERSIGEKWKDKQAHPEDWEVTNEKEEPGNVKGTKSYEREYTNKKTGEKLYEHEIKNSSGKSTHGPHPRGYGK